ncbi:MAG: sigma-70 family RNA polymerase sigma factor [Synergistetes bacterium]|nr:sigma-70 family RNA polymerase sigma factor [Synergistota bacterium]MDW8193125.1 sigma-70 family RNA polymerase sigma factor [Synergistota bacterium]
MEEYLRALSKVKILEQAEEEELWRKFKEEGDEESRAKIIESYQPLVFKVLSKIGHPPELTLDLLQEGIVGLIEAVDRFEPERGWKFYTFAYYRIKGSILNALTRKMPAWELVDEADPKEGSFDEDLLSIGLEVLPSEDKKVINGIYYEGKGLKDIAKELGFSLSKIQRIHKRALKRLKEVLG